MRVVINATITTHGENDSQLVMVLMVLIHEHARIWWLMNRQYNHSPDEPMVMATTTIRWYYLLTRTIVVNAVMMVVVMVMVMMMKSHHPSPSPASQLGCRVDCDKVGITIPRGPSKKPSSAAPTATRAHVAQIKGTTPTTSSTRLAAADNDDDDELITPQLPTTLQTIHEKKKLKHYGWCSKNQIIVYAQLRMPNDQRICCVRLIQKILDELLN